MTKTHLLGTLPVLLVFTCTYYYFFGFTAEDAYITYRYAENWLDIGALVYNRNEPINALTSPLHAVISTLLYALTHHTVITNKILAVIALMLSAYWLWRLFRVEPWLQLLVICLVVLPPCVVLWTAGGLETPFLLAIVTAASVLLYRSSEFGLKALWGLFMLAGLGFLTRYDSALFFLPLLGYGAWRNKNPAHLLIAALCGGALPVLWLVISLGYYGDLFPTSFYIKTPGFGAELIRQNAQYIAWYLLITGIIPALILAPLICPGRAIVVVWSEQLRRLWWLYLGLALELCYGLTMATHHMMFSLRFFVPYIPVAALLIADLLQRCLYSPPAQASARKSRALLLIGVCLLAPFQAFQSVYTYRYSLNGLSPIGEYGALGVRDYGKFLTLLETEAETLNRHWNSLKPASQRPPRLFVYAGGLLPYRYREAYIYEALVSYRHLPPNEPRVTAPNIWFDMACDLRASADYIQLLTPRHGRIPYQLPVPASSLQLVSAQEMVFDGSNQAFLVFYNPNPRPHVLGAHLNEGCI